MNLSLQLKLINKNDCIAQRKMIVLHKEISCLLLFVKLLQPVVEVQM